MVTGTWTRNTSLENPRITLSNTTGGDHVYTTTVEINPLSNNMDEDDGTYTCQAVISPQAPQNGFITGITTNNLRDIDVRGEC